VSQKRKILLSYLTYHCREVIDERQYYQVAGEGKRTRPEGRCEIPPETIQGVCDGRILKTGREGSIFRLGRYPRFPSRIGTANSVLRFQEHNRQRGNHTAPFQFPVGKSYHPRNFNERADLKYEASHEWPRIWIGRERRMSITFDSPCSHLARPTRLGMLGLTISRRAIQVPAPSEASCNAFD